MKIVKILLGLLGGLAIILTVFYAYLGGFQTIQVQEATAGPFQVIVTTHRGSYSGLSNSWDHFVARVQEAGLKECDALAFYLDPPGTPEDQLRSVLACRLEAIPEPERQKLAAGFSVYSMPAVPALHATFPFRNFFSYMVGPTKVYPAMQKATEGKPAPRFAIETYGVDGRSTEIGFFMPLSADEALVAPLIALFP
ncbi:MAG: hypothetical protein HS115_00920 [Spirochaetales bacterium]|nr:hypothetical protein [Spirochaetales bacterium]